MIFINPTDSRVQDNVGGVKLRATNKRLFRPIYVNSMVLQARKILCLCSDVSRKNEKQIVIN